MSPQPPQPPQTLEEILAAGQAAIDVEFAREKAQEEAIQAKRQAICAAAQQAALAHIPSVLHNYVGASSEKEPGIVKIKIIIPNALPVTMVYTDTVGNAYDIEDPEHLNPDNWHISTNRYHDEIFVWDDHYQAYRFEGKLYEISKALIFARQYFPKPEPAPHPSTQPTLYARLTEKIETAAEHFDKKNHERGMEYIMLAIVEALVDLAETQYCIATN